MRSLFGTVAQVFNKTPIPYVGRGSDVAFPMFGGGSREAQLRAMGSVGTLFAIVDRLANATSQVDWKLWRKAPSGNEDDRVEVTRHAALDIWNKPNDFYTRQELVEAAQQHWELTGEWWLLVGRNPSLRSIPLDLWVVRPDFMAPIPDRENYLRGYLYHGPDGEKIPFATDEVLFGRRPNPLDAYRGMGPVQAIMVNLDTAKYTAEWNRNFFLNSAEPGGIIEVDRRLSDDEFDEMTDRWRRQHQGVSKAHRVAVIEQGKWVDRKFSMRDMQFAELDQVGVDTIRRAYGMPKFALGDVDDVNRANAEASEAWFAQWLIVPRLERWKGLLNNDYLPLFGATAANLEFDYENPAPSNTEAENAERESVAIAVKTYAEAGFDPASAAEALGAPKMKMAPKPAAPPAPPPGAPPAPGEPPGGQAPTVRIELVGPFAHPAGEYADSTIRMTTKRVRRGRNSSTS